MKNGLESQIYEFGEFRIDAAKRLLLRATDEIIPLTPKIFDTLLYLVLNNGKVIDKDELMREIWTDTIVEENNLNKNISVLRRTLGEKPGEHRFIVTVPGQGYKFVAEVRPILDHGVGIADFNADETIFEDRITKTNDQTTQDEGHRTKEKITSHFQFLTLAVFSVFALGLLGFYLWRENTKFVSTNPPMKTMAVLPFKPLVRENRDEVLEMGMADTLIARLGGNREIVVRPLSSVRRFVNLEQSQHRKC